MVKTAREKVLETLKEEPKTTTELRKLHICCNSVLNDILNQLEKEEFISHEDKSSQKSKWKVNELKLKNSALFHTVFAAWLYRRCQALYGGHLGVLFDLELKNKLPNPTYNEFREYVKKEEICLLNKALPDKTLNKNDMLRLCDNSIDEIQKLIGETIINLLVMQSENDTVSPDTVIKFIRFVSIYFKHSLILQESIKKTRSYKEMKSTSQLPYPTIENTVLIPMLAESAFEYTKREHSSDANWNNTLQLADEEFEEMGFPFRTIYKRLKNDKSNKLFHD